jgi:hypothetical protein
VIEVDVSELLNPEDGGFVQGNVFLLKIVEEMMSEQDSMADILESISFSSSSLCVEE